MQQHILIGRKLVDGPNLGPRLLNATWPVIQSHISVPSEWRLRVAVDVYCVAVYGRHEYEEKTLRYDDGAGIVWFAGRCRNCGTITYVPQPNTEHSVSLPFEGSPLVAIDTNPR